MKEFAIKLKQIRKRENYTQKALASELNVPLSTYKNWESLGSGHKTPNLEMLIKLSHILNVSPDELAGIR